MGMMLDLHLLGGFRLVFGDAPVTAIDSPRLQSLIAYLALHRDAPQPRRQMAYLLWPDSEEAQARTNLRNLLHHLRHALPEAERFVRLDGTTIQWAPDAPCTIDVFAFERAAQAGALQEALALYAGDLLPECYDDWVIPERERLQALFAGVLQRMARSLEDQRDYQGAIDTIRRLIRCDPLREEPYRDLMRLHALNGDRAAAIHAYHTCADTLQQELGVEPGAATRQVYERLLSERAGVAEPLVALRGTLPLVGRQQEWNQLLAAWRGAVAGVPRMVLLEGEAGIGKTRLVEELVAWATRQGLQAMSANCYAPARTLAYAPVAAWLRARPLPPLEPVWLTELARLLPELLERHPNLPPPGPLVDEWQRQRLFTALARAILGSGQPLLLVIEDLQWCDPDTLDWLHLLLRRDAHSRLLVVGTLRQGEAGSAEGLEALFASLRRDDALVEIAIGPLGQGEAAALAAHAAGHPLTPQQAARLYHDTEGNPLFVVEAVRAGAFDAQAPEPAASLEGAAAQPRTLPPRVQAVLATRLLALSPAARELLAVAATVGREFTFDVLRRASGGDEDVLVGALDELWQRRIVRERGEASYDFGHHYLREAAYNALSAARRHILHRRVAEAMETAGDGQAEDLAYHFERAQAWDRAARYHHLAGQQAQRLYANATAVAHLQQALVLAERAGLGAEMRFEILAAREEVHEIMGQREARARDLEAMATLAREALGPAQQAQVCRRQARLLTDSGRYDEAEAAANEALALAEQAGDPVGQAAALIALGTAADLRGEPAWAIPHLRAAVEIAGAGAAGEAGRRLGATAHQALASALLALREYDAARSEAGAALALYEELGNQQGQVEALNALGVIGMEQGAFDDATGRYQRALDICRTIGYRYGEARALVNLGNIYYVRGQLGEALARYDQGAAIFHAIGHPRGETIARMNTADIRLTVFGDAEAARADIEAALAYAREAGEHSSEGQSLTVLGTIARQLGDLAEARRRLQASIALLRAAGEQWLEAQARTTLVHVELDAQRPHAALASLEAAEAMCHERGMASLQGDLSTARGSVLLALGQPEEALTALAGAEAQAGSGVQRTYLAPYVRYQALLALGRSDEARAALEQAYRAVLDLIKALTPEEQQRCLERQPEFRAIAEAWRAAGAG